MHDRTMSDDTYRTITIDFPKDYFTFDQSIEGYMIYGIHTVECMMSAV